MVLARQSTCENGQEEDLNRHMHGGCLVFVIWNLLTSLGLQ